jgi:hypothetical protein
MVRPATALPRSVPRDVQLTAGGRAVAAVATLLIVGGLAAGIGLYALSRRQAATSHDLVERGVTTVGHVTTLWTKGDDRHRVAYRFTVDGRTFGNRVRVPDNVRRALRVGSPLGVRYLPASPDVNDLGGAPRRALPLPVPFIVGALAPACGVLCLVVIDRQRRLLAEGWVTQGIVTSISTHKNNHGVTHRTLKYEFTLLSGVKATGKTETLSKEPTVGGTVAVVYDLDSPHRNHTYPFPLVKGAD